MPILPGTAGAARAAGAGAVAGRLYLTRARRANWPSQCTRCWQLAACPALTTWGCSMTRWLRCCRRSRPGTVAVPRIRQAKDDRRPRAEWDTVTGALDLVLLEGGAWAPAPSPAQLDPPVNELERHEDPHATWRAYVNDVLAADFPPCTSAWTPGSCCRRPRSVAFSLASRAGAQAGPKHAWAGGGRDGRGSGCTFYSALPAADRALPGNAARCSRLPLPAG